jgi:hypothetical protein
MLKQIKTEKPKAKKRPLKTTADKLIEEIKNGKAEKLIFVIKNKIHFACCK